MLSKDEFLKPLAAARPAGAVVVTSMGVVRPWARFSESPLDFASADSAMGHTADFALGIALAQPSRKVICLNGDGSMLMSLGTLATIAESGARNLVLFVVQNDTYEVTGNQAVPAGGRLDWASIARGSGILRAHAYEDPARYAAGVADLLQGEGPVFAAVRVEKGAERPLGRGPGQAEAYLRPSLAESARRLREALRQPEQTPRKMI